MATHLRTELVVEALEMAVEQRRPEAVVHHSDQGCQYTSLAFGGRCREWGVALSMGSVGDCFDNAMAESFFATLECELLARTTLATHAEARAAIFEFVEGWYNTRRRHSALGYASPLEFECCRARRTDRNWTRVDRKMLWSPAASSSQQRARVLTDVKARRFAPPPLRGADGLDAGSAHARPDWLLPTMLTHTPPTCCGRRPVQNDALSGDR